MLAAPAGGAPLKFGELVLEPGKLAEFTVPLATADTARAATGGNPRATQARGAIAVPPAFDAKKSWPILVVNATSDNHLSSIAAARRFAPTALAAGWIVMAAEGPVPPKIDDVSWRWPMHSAVMRHIYETWPGAEKWPVACGGFSGGAKWSGFMSALFSKGDVKMVGVFMGGCNADTPSLAFASFKPGARYKQVPMFLSSGDKDSIATPNQQRDVKASLLRAGFQNVRLETYPGPHRLDTNQLALALQWFTGLQNTTNAPAKPGSEIPR